MWTRRASSCVCRRGCRRVGSSPSLIKRRRSAALDAGEVSRYYVIAVRRLLADRGRAPYRGQRVVARLHGDAQDTALRFASTPISPGMRGAGPAAAEPDTGCEDSTPGAAGQGREHRIHGLRSAVHRDVCVVLRHHHERRVHAAKRGEGERKPHGGSALTEYPAARADAGQGARPGRCGSCADDDLVGRWADHTWQRPDDRDHCGRTGAPGSISSRWLGSIFCSDICSMRRCWAPWALWLTTAREGAQFTFVIILPLLVPFYLNQAFTTDPNGPLVTILSIFPLTRARRR